MFWNTNTSFGKTLDIIKRGMDVAVIRQAVIADNIANANTPGFKRTEVTFEAQLKRALDSEKPPEFPALMTDKRHIPFEDYIDYRTVRAQLVKEWDVFYRNDKNGVDIDKEMVDSLKNMMRYNLFSELYARELRKVDLILR